MHESPWLIPADEWKDLAKEPLETLFSFLNEEQGTLMIIPSTYLHEEEVIFQKKVRGDSGKLQWMLVETKKKKKKKKKGQLFKL